MTIEMLFDDGYVLYINGQEVDRLCMNAGTVTYDTWANTTIGTSGTYTQNTYASRTVTIPAGILQAGKNVIAAEVHQIHGTSTDLYWDCSLATTAASYTSTQSVTTEIELRGTGAILKARAYNGSEWSALTELAYTTTAPVQDRSGLKISEIMHAPNKADNIAPYDEDSFSWIELQNTGPTTINLFGCTLAGEKFTATVAPHLVPKEKLLANVTGVMNAVAVRGNAVGETLFYGAGAGRMPTASAMVADIIDTMRRGNGRKFIDWGPEQPDRLVDPQVVPTRWYVRTADGAYITEPLECQEAIARSAGAKLLALFPVLD